MKLISAFALVASLAVAGCATVAPTTITTSSVVAPSRITAVSNEAFERQINPQRPRDCGRKYVVDPEDPCY